MPTRKKTKRVASKSRKRTTRTTRRKKKTGLTVEAKKTGKAIGAVLRTALKTVDKSRKKVGKALGV